MHDTKKYPVSIPGTRRPDARYSIAQEYCGHAEPRFVARFCGEWIGQSKFYASALSMAVCAAARNRGAASE
jgi:hypothetical protein